MTIQELIDKLASLPPGAQVKLILFTGEKPTVEFEISDNGVETNISIPVDEY